jgi:hypothetical protein
MLSAGEGERYRGARVEWIWPVGEKANSFGFFSSTERIYTLTVNTSSLTSRTDSRYPSLTRTMQKSDCTVSVGHHI